MAAAQTHVEYQSSRYQSAHTAVGARPQLNNQSRGSPEGARRSVTLLSPGSGSPSGPVVTIHVPADVPQDHVENKEDGKDEESHQDRLRHRRD